MKVCAICGYVANNIAPTCPNCGEASWESPDEKPEPATEPVKPTAPEPPPVYHRPDRRHRR